MLRCDDEWAKSLQLLIEVDVVESPLEGVSDVVIVRFDCQFEQRKGLIFGERGHCRVKLELVDKLLF